MIWQIIYWFGIHFEQVVWGLIIFMTVCLILEVIIWLNDSNRS